MDSPWHIYLMAVLYILAGINHFRKPHIYIKIIPNYFPNPALLNAISGGTEILLGVLLCIPVVSQYAALGIIALLIAIFPANLFMYSNMEASLGIPKWVLLLRLPLQIVLIIWAYQYTFFIH
ncbi:DoxX family protein [Flavobacterium sp. GT3R68]|uniref:DoxX family protein n=1 Tax=Flavobacterium sp. GT3R68 TaxID=2594437 RepID=UPI000F8639CC|nr:DoxX family protein [Flavobacterium sp. GT3R68]RTY93368.1 DoxX family protein [Flavobacterium sp. GSN2]TRW92458.1 DoxX family protein [Flavobacterium sp. GT3R68]